MKITKSLEKKSNHQVPVNADLDFNVIKNSDGSYSYQKRETGELYNPCVSFDKFMDLMPQVGASHCPHYGCDD